jgi:hypothetical protein
MDDRFRVSDADRDRATALLRDHFAAGRLTAGELDERLAATLDAKTVGDLRRVLADLPGTAPAAQQASPGSLHATSLERGYRRLLACYPVWYRRVHEEEMLAVLMTGTLPGKRRPGIGEAADLLLGALRIRCQPSRGGEPGWRDALAVLSVIVPLIAAVAFAVQQTQILLFVPFPYRFPQWVLNTMAPPVALAALVPLALRTQRLAALAGAGLLIWLVSSQPGLVTGGATGLPLAVGLQIAALTASPGPRRGLQILTWKHAAVAVIATLLICATVIPAAPAVRLIVIAVTGAGMALASSLGRWLLLLLAIPAPLLLPIFGAPPFPPALAIAQAFLPYPAAWTVACYLPSLALVALAALAARRASSRSHLSLRTPSAST